MKKNLLEWVLNLSINKYFYIFVTATRPWTEIYKQINQVPPVEILSLNCYFRLALLQSRTLTVVKDEIITFVVRELIKSSAKSPHFGFVCSAYCPILHRVIIRFFFQLSFGLYSCCLYFINFIKPKLICPTGGCLKIFRNE